MSDCPVCRRALEASDAVCSRCGVEVKNLLALERAARRLILSGIELLRQRRFAEARAAFMRSLALRRSEKAARGAAVALLCAGSFAEALRSRQKMP